METLDYRFTGIERNDLTILRDRDRIEHPENHVDPYNLPAARTEPKEDHS